MKKIASIILTLALGTGLLAACSAPSSSAVESSTVASSAVESSTAPSSTAAERTAFNIASLKGPTTMGLVKLMDTAEGKTARHDYAVTMYGTADEITPLLVKGDLDVALVPANLASVLYNKTEGALQIVAVNTLGVLYVVTTDDTVKTVADLKGKTIYSMGQGTTPEYVLNYVLEQNGLAVGTDVMVEYKSEATEVLAAVQAAGENAIAMLPQPYVTTVTMQVEGLAIALDMTAEWNKVSNGNDLVTGVVVAQKSFIEENTAAFNEFMADYKDSVDWVTANNAQAAALVVKYEIVPKAPIAEKALPGCNIVFESGAKMKADVSAYLQVLFDANPKSVGGKLPLDDFYYGA